VTTTDEQRETTRRDITRRDALTARWVARTGPLLDVLAWVFLVDFAAGRLIPGGPSWFHPALGFISFAIWFAFAVDYVVRLVLSSQRWIFVGTHKLDLVMVALPMLRILRVILLLRKSFRSISTERIASSLISIVIGIVLVGGFLEWLIEHNAPGANITTLGTGLWWSIVTTTTVGYGDTYPVTTAGRLVGSVVMVVGIGLIGTVSATVAAWFVSHKQRLQDEKKAAATAASAESAAASAESAAAKAAGGSAPATKESAGAALSVPESIAALAAKLDELAREQAELVASIAMLTRRESPGQLSAGDQH
jgi:voltage-gated potassium channel